MPLMRLRLIIRRHRLMDLRILWSLEEVGYGDFGTVANLLHRVDEMFGLTSGTHGLEEYIVELDGFECLHFSPLATILKDNDEVVIRPFNTFEIRHRRSTGRLAVSAAGAPIVDGVVFGRRDPDHGGPPKQTPIPQRSYLTNIVTDPASYADLSEQGSTQLSLDSPELNEQSWMDQLVGIGNGDLQSAASIPRVARKPRNVKFDDEPRKRCQQGLSKKRSRTELEYNKFKGHITGPDSDSTYPSNSSEADSESDSECSNSGDEDDALENEPSSDSNSDSGPEISSSHAPPPPQNASESQPTSTVALITATTSHNPSQDSVQKLSIPPGQGLSKTKKRNARRRLNRQHKGVEKDVQTGKLGSTTKVQDDTPNPPSKRQKTNNHTIRNQEISIADHNLVGRDMASSPGTGQNPLSDPTVAELEYLNSILAINSVECVSDQAPSAPTFPFTSNFQAHQSQRSQRSQRSQHALSSHGSQHSHSTTTRSLSNVLPNNTRTPSSNAEPGSDNSSESDLDSESSLGSSIGPSSSSGSDLDSDSSSGTDSSSDSDFSSISASDTSSQSLSDLRRLGSTSNQAKGLCTPDQVALQLANDASLTLPSIPFDSYNDLPLLPNPSLATTKFTKVKGDYTVPIVPKSTAKLPLAIVGTLRPSDIIIFKQLECSEKTHWQPQVSGFVSGRILSLTVTVAPSSSSLLNIKNKQNLTTTSRRWKHSPSNPLIKFRLAADYVPVKEIKYDSAGKRIYGTYEMAGYDDHLLEEPDDGIRELSFSEMIEPKILASS